MKKILITLACLLCLTGCSNGTGVIETTEVASSSAEPVVEEVAQDYQEVELTELSDVYNNGEGFNTLNKQYDKFATNVFKNTVKENENGLVSPYSLYAVLSVLSNGAVNSDKAQTKQLLENVLGMTVNDMNAFYSELGNGLDIFNALLFNSDSGVSIDENVRKTIEEYYGNAIEERSFSDASAVVEDVNNWSNEKTSGAIPTILDEGDLQPDTVMVLLNALSVDGLWEFPFESSETVLQNFTNSDQSNVNVSMMHQTVDGYWETDNAKGFTKDVLSNGGSYTFVGILPDEDIDINEFIANMDENTISNMMDSYLYYDNIDESSRTADIHITNLSFPKFNYSVTNELDEPLKKLGLNPLFSKDTCDFSLFGSENIDVQKVKQKTNVEVNEEKVKMSAATVAIGGLGNAGAYNIRNIIEHDVVFDRPFIYALYTTQYDFPAVKQTLVFMGVVNNFENETEVNSSGQSIGKIWIDVDKINVRSTPTTSEDNKVDTVTIGQQLSVYEITENEGYTWYRIDEDRWIADNGSWVTYSAN